MADKTKIQWSDYTLNFMVGCSKVSAGCDNCYAVDVANALEVRFQSEKYKGLTVINHPPSPSSTKEGAMLDWTGEIRIIDELILKPLHLKKPRKIFVNSMSDLFHERILTDINLRNAVWRFFLVMLKANHHQYQILTKRAHIMRDIIKEFMISAGLTELPKHIWLGVSVENQRTADVRIPKLLEIPGGTKWLSCEPLLESVDLCHIGKDVLNPLGYFNGINWVVVGGESGKGAREMELSWAGRIVEDCKGNGVPVFVKQLGIVRAKVGHLTDKKGGNMDEWPESLRVREFPE